MKCEKGSWCRSMFRWSVLGGMKIDILLANMERMAWMRKTSQPAASQQKQKWRAEWAQLDYHLQKYNFMINDSIVQCKEEFGIFSLSLHLLLCAWNDNFLDFCSLSNDERGNPNNRQNFKLFFLHGAATQSIEDFWGFFNLLKALFENFWVWPVIHFCWIASISLEYIRQ